MSSITTLDDIRSASLARERFLATLLASFASFGLILGLVGIYGVTAQLTRRRFREMAIHLALGARSSQVQWLALKRGIGLTLIGIGLGVAVALVVTRTLRSLLYQVEPADPATFILVPVATVATAVLASWLPARRAGHADPNVALRAD